MQKFKDLFTSSYREFKNVRSITLMAMFGAISIILGFFSIMILDYLRVGFNFLPNIFIYYLFGPVVGPVFGGMMDVLTYLVKPMGPFFPGFTISGILNGLIYGMILYKRPLTMKRIFIANLISMLLVELPLNTYWLSILYGNAYLAMIPGRAIKEVIMLVVKTGMSFALIKGVEATGILEQFRGRKAKHPVK